MRTVASRVMWVGRATVFLVGLAVILALVLGFASAAFGANGDFLRLGSQKNVATRVTALVGKVAAGPALSVRNPSGGQALDLRVSAGKSPMSVNSTTQVANLNSDLIDGKDSSAFMASSVYKTEAATDQGTLLGDGTEVKSMSCDAGDTVLSGGPASVNANSAVLDSFPTDTRTWQARIRPVAGGDNFTVVILCANNQ